MPYPVRVHCQCGQFQAQLKPAHIPLLARCYCQDCQRYAQYFDHPEQLLDAKNTAGQTGSAVMVIHPPQLQIIQGLTQLRCLQQSPKGAWRWYASCCQTPILNMAAQVQTHHLALLVSALEPSARQHYLAQPMLNVRQRASLKMPLQQRFAFISFALHYALGVIRAKLTQAHRHNPLIDPQNLKPIAAVELLSKQQFEQLEAKQLQSQNHNNDHV